MNRLENMSKPLVWSTALLLTAIVAGCGGSTGATGAPGASGAPGAPGGSGAPALGAVVNLLSAKSYVLTTSAGFTSSGSAVFGGDVAMDAPTQSCTATPAASAAGADGNTCGMANTTTPAFTIPASLAVTGNTIRYALTNPTAFNTSVRAVKNDVNAAWIDAFNRVGGTAIAGPGALDGLTLLPGIYTSASTMKLGAGKTLTLDAANNPTAVWIFQVGSSLTVTGGTTAPTQVKLINLAQAKNVFWQVGTPNSSGGLVAGGGDVTFPASTGAGNSTIFMGTILAGNSVTFAGDTALTGRVLAGAALVGTPNTQTGGTVTTTATAASGVTVTLP